MERTAPTLTGTAARVAVSGLFKEMSALTVAVPEAVVVKALLRPIKAPTVTVPEALAVSEAEIVMEVGVTAVMTAPAGIPVPVRVWPTKSPVVAVVVMVRVPTAPPVAKNDVFGVIEAILAPTGMPVPETVWPTASPAEETVRRFAVPAMPPEMVKVVLATMFVMYDPSAMPVPTMTWPTPRPFEEEAVSSVVLMLPVVGVKVIVGAAVSAKAGTAAIALLRFTMAPTVTVPAAVAVNGAEMVMEVGVTAKMVAPAGMPVPATVWPTNKPAVAAVVIVDAPDAPPVAKNVVLATTPVIKVPGWRPAPVRIWPAWRPVAESVVSDVVVNAPVGTNVTILSKGLT